MAYDGYEEFDYDDGEVDVMAEENDDLVLPPLTRNDGRSASSSGNFGTIRDEQFRRKKYTMTSRKPATVYHCGECDKVFRHPSKIAEHKRKHNGERPYACHICGTRFTQGGSLKAHCKVHMGELPFKCSYCPAQFQTTGQRRIHEKEHMDDEEGNLLKDDDGDVSSSVAGQAVIMEGDEGQSYVFGCYATNCNFTCEREDDLHTHYAEVHGIEGVTYEDETEHFQEIHDGYEYEDYYVEEVPEGVEPAALEVSAEEEVEAGPSSLHEAEGGEEEALLEESPPPPRPALIIQHDEHIDTKTAMGDRRTKRMLTLSLEADERDYEEHDDMYGEKGHISVEVAPAPLYEEEVMTTSERRMGLRRGKVYADLTKIQLDPIMDVDGLEEGRVRVEGDPRPPVKGRKKAFDEPTVVDIEMDVAVLQQVVPQNLKGGRSKQRKDRRTLPLGKSRNLDWIIDAVSKGRDVDAASPHNRKKPHVQSCPYCGRVDKYPSKIAAHIRTHTGEKPYKCEICGTGFAQRTPMRMHMRRHLNQRPFDCDFPGCDATFISQALLNSHQSTKHFNSKRYVCMKGCGRVFASGRNQRAHETRCLATGLGRSVVTTDYMPGGQPYLIDPMAPDYMDDEEEPVMMEEVDEDEEEEEREFKPMLSVNEDEVDVVSDDTIARIQPQFL